MNEEQIIKLVRKAMQSMLVGIAISYRDRAANRFLGVEVGLQMMDIVDGLDKPESIAILQQILAEQMKK